MKLEHLFEIGASKMGIIIILATLIASCGLASPMNTQKSGTITGQWTIEPAQGNEVRLILERRTSQDTSTTTINTPIESLIGLSRDQMTANSPVRFELKREAGTFTCEGKFDGGKGTGNFVFSANPDFSRNLSALGYSNLSNQTVFKMALYDVTSTFLRDLKSLGYNNVSVDQLIPMRVHEISTDYISELQTLGYKNVPIDQLIPMRVHDVSIDYVRGLKEVGYADVPLDQLVPMRIHGVSIQYLKELKALGYNHVPSSQLVPLAVHKVTPDFIRQAKARSQSTPPVEELIRMRISGKFN